MCSAGAGGRNAIGHAEETVYRLLSLKTYDELLTMAPMSTERWGCAVFERGHIYVFGGGEASAE